MINYSDEIICNYLVTAKQKKIWQIEVEILQEFMQVCNKYHLKFFVAHGTLLGAVRHKGFIPWDDDIDVNMPRRDYELLIKIADKEFNKPYFFQTYLSDPGNFNGHAKLKREDTTGMDLQNIGHMCNNGLFIDIFPMDGIVEDERKRQKQSKRVELYRGLMLAKVYGKDYRYMAGFSKRKFTLYKIISKFLKGKFIYSKFEEWCQKYSYIDTKRLGIISFKTDYECCYWYKEDFEELIELNFEGIKVPAPLNYDRCLRIKWNNYMEFPSERQRGYKHIDVIMDDKISYKEYDISKFEDIFQKAKNYRISVFGAGKVLEDYLKAYGQKYSPYVIFDNDSKKWKKIIEKSVIEPPEEILKLNPVLDVIIITSTYFHEIECKLLEIGWKNYYIYLEGRIYKK